MPHWRDISDYAIWNQAISWPVWVHLSQFRQNCLEIMRRNFLPRIEVIACLVFLNGAVKNEKKIKLKKSKYAFFGILDLVQRSRKSISDAESDV